MRSIKNVIEVAFVTLCIWTVTIMAIVAVMKGLVFVLGFTQEEAKHALALALLIVGPIVYFITYVLVSEAMYK